MQKLVLATTNPGKIADYQTLLQPYPIQLISQAEMSVPEVEETGLSFVENALIKARHASSLTNLPALGDDSGLVVDALKGAPGLYSARFAGPKASAEDNIAKLVQELNGIPKDKRTARFYAIIVLVRYPHDPAPIICEGTWEGEILNEATGENGFGYLPIFYSYANQKPAAFLTQEERVLVNHRGKAFRQLIEKYLQKNA